MRLTGDGLFVVDAGEPLSPALFAALLARGAPFALKADYRGLPPPIEELDLVHLAPAAGSRRGTLVLHRLDDGGFEFTRTPPARGGAHARVVSVDRPGQRHDLARRRWRVLGRGLAASPGFARMFTATRGLFVRVWRPMPPATAPLRIAAADDVVAEVRAKWAAPAEVRHTVRAGRALESWEKDLIERLVPARARILVIGCGAGREALAFAERGFRVTGIDFVEAVVDEARRRAAADGLPATFETSTAEALIERAPGGFDVVIATAPVYEQTPGRERRVAFLRALARLTAPDGLVVLGAASHRDRGPRRTVIDGVRWLLRRLGVPSIAEPGDRFTYHVSLASHHATKCFYHRFQRPDEIAGELRAAGLDGTRHPEGPWLARTARAPREADVILALLRGDVPLAPVEWEQVAELSVHEGVAPLIFSRLAATAVPDDVRARLGAIYERTWARNAVLSGRWTEIVRALDAAGVRALALKGMALLQTTYADPGVRPMADLDVLVPEADFERARTTLLRDGWTAADGPDAAANAYRGYAHLTRGGAVLDLHRELAGYPRVAAVVRVDHAGLWARAQRLPGGGWYLAPEDQLLHLALHLVLGSEFGRLLNFVDVDRVVRNGGLRWDVLLEEAARWRVRSVLGYVLRAAAGALGTPVPPAVRARLAPSFSSRLAERVLGTTGIPTLGARPSELRLYLAETLLMDRARWAMRVATTTLFPPAPWLRFHYGARSRWQVGIARALHPLRVCARVVAPGA
jgi:2-polyprenyl-3-methyl-5-hydroxy-6-metoxy-1,4-benzoquinol methylase